MKSALIVIDVQESFTRRPYFSAADVPAYLAAQNRLIEGFEAQGLPIVRVFHVSPGGDAGDAFALASGLVKPLEGLRPFTAAHEVHKTRHSALVGTGLDVWLTQQGIGQIVISDRLADGQQFVTSPSAPSLKIQDQFGSYTNVPITPVEVGDPYSTCPTSVGSPQGTTNLVFRQLNSSALELTFMHEP